MLGLTLIWFCGVSLFCLALMYWDKRSAVKRERRIPERTILLWAYLGGGVGAVIAQKMFRHKTVKEPFRTLLMGSLFFNVLLLLLLVIPTMREAALSALNALF